jgi:seryl-tRNA synthetase
MEFFRSKGYGSRMMVTPYLMRRSVEEKITFFEAFQDTIFEVESEKMILIPSSEHSIVAFYQNRLFEEGELPIRVIAWSPSFRKEAGAHGKDTRGIFRVKQFHKVEIHSIVEQGQDMEELDRMTSDVQDFLDTLQLPNRSVILPTGDMDKRALKQVDVETWMPAQGAYRETHSLATLGTWVSEKLQLRYRTDKNKKNLTCNIYATAAAIQRLICAIIENHYDPTSQSVHIPQVLMKYMMDVTEIKLNDRKLS